MPSVTLEDTPGDFPQIDTPDNTSAVLQSTTRQKKQLEIFLWTQKLKKLSRR